MVIIGFSTKSSFIIPRILCKHFKHCAIITPYKKRLLLYQFIRRGNVAKINISEQSITQLRKFGWSFIYLPIDICLDFNPYTAKTCVDMVKNAIGIKKISIQTPDSLYKCLVH